MSADKNLNKHVIGSIWPDLNSKYFSKEMFKARVMPDINQMRSSSDSFFKSQYDSFQMETKDLIFNNKNTLADKISFLETDSSNDLLIKLKNDFKKNMSLSNSKESIRSFYNLSILYWAIRNDFLKENKPLFSNIINKKRIILA